MYRVIAPAGRLVPAMLLFFAFLFSQYGCSAHALDANGGGYSVTLVDAWGRELPTYRHRGATYIKGDVGDRYSVRVKNHTGARIEVVVTVDGRDVLTGDVGDYRAQRGYLVSPWQTVTIDGFRKSMSQVAAFRFTSPGDSYSARRGTPQNVGVIGVAVFAEKTYPRPHPVHRTPVARPSHGWLDNDGDYEYEQRGAGGEAKDDSYADAEDAAPPQAAPSGTASEARSRGDSDNAYGRREAPQKRNNIGTQYGETRASGVVEVSFVRARPSNPERLLGVYYDDARGLEARGIRLSPHVTGEPDPFPGQRRFAPAPR